jgi:D-amino-acid dehydrogenase
MAEDVPVKRGYGLKFEVLDRDAAIAREPSLAPVFRRAVWWSDPISSTDPGGSTKAIAGLAQRHGGLFVRGDARSLRRERDDYLVETVEGPVTAPVFVIALGPWSGEIAARFGAKLPFAVKRGYHMHYRPRGNAVLGTPLYDMDCGFYLAPMARGIRLTTGIEFARADAPPTPVQLARTKPLADTLFPLGEAMDAEPWMGRRPCLPDSLPVIGRLPGAPGLIAAFGHQHLGFTMGPITGRLVADIVTGETPVVDPAPYRVERFG